MHSYRLRMSMVAVARDAMSQMTILTLPAGAVLQVASVTLQSGLVDARWDSRTVSVFMEDLKARGDLIRGTGA